MRTKQSVVLAAADFKLEGEVRMGVLPRQRGRILHKLTHYKLIQVNKQNQAKPIPELKTALAATNIFGGGREGYYQDDKQILSMLALFTCTKFAGKFADEIGKGRGIRRPAVAPSDTAPKSFLMRAVEHSWAYGKSTSRNLGNGKQRTV